MVLYEKLTQKCDFTWVKIAFTQKPIIKVPCVLPHGLPTRKSDSFNSSYRTNRPSMIEQLGVDSVLPPPMFHFQQRKICF